MGLKENIDSILMRHDLCRNEYDETVEQLFELFEKEADNHAIVFLNYYLHNKQNNRYVFSNLSAEEALKIFKQEKQKRGE
jgi:hypothetical protein